jgi:large subunit ribosomal protein L31
MRDIHPNYPDATIACACGNSVKTRSTRGNFTVDVCGACHPFYTGKQKLMDTAGRVDRFRKKFAEVVKSDRAKGGAAPATQTQPKKEKPAKGEKAEPAKAE